MLATKHLLEAPETVWNMHKLQIWNAECVLEFKS